MDKNKIKELITLVRQFNGFLTLSYTPSSVLKSTKSLYGIYYGGWSKIEIGEYYTNRGEHIEITDANVDEIAEKIYNVLSDCVGYEIMQALDNLKLDAEDLKYFDRDLELFKKYKKEVRRLKKENLK